MAVSDRVVRAAAADDDAESSQVDDVELASDSSSHDDHLDFETTSPQTVVPNLSSSTSDSIANDITEEPHNSHIYTQSTLCGDPEPLQVDTEDVSHVTDSLCNNAARAVQGLAEVSAVNTSSEAEAGDSETGDVSQSSVSVDADETEVADLSEDVTTDDVRYPNHLSLCSELSSSLTDSLDICEQGGMVDADGHGLVAAVDSGAVNATDSMLPASKGALASCQCSDNSSADTEDDGHMVQLSAMPDDSSQCDCDVTGAVSNNIISVDPDKTEAELETEMGRLSSESMRMLNDLDQSSVASDKDFRSMSADVEASQRISGDAADITFSPALNLDDHDTAALSPYASEACVSGMEMETGSGNSSSPVIDAGIISSALEPDGEPGGKASKLDQPLTTDCSDSEPSDTGALHMSVGFQSSPGNEKVVATFKDDSRDTSIGVLMLCDDDGVISPVRAEPSVTVSDSSEAGVVASSIGGDYNSVVTVASSFFTSATETRPLVIAGTESDDMRLAESSSGTVAAEDVMLCEVESKSQELDELLTDVSQTIVNSSHVTQLSDNSIYSHDESEFHYHKLTRRSLKDLFKRIIFVTGEGGYPPVKGFSF